MKTLSIFALMMCFSTTALAEEFCGRIRAASYIKKSSGVEAFVHLDQLRGAQSYASLRNTSLKLRDVEAAYKIAYVIALSSIQNSTQLKQDLANENFDWYFLVGDEQSRNPYEEDFSVCLDADLSQVTQQNELFKVFAVTDIFEDGHSLKDLL